MKFRHFSLSKATTGLLICTLAFTALVRGNAGSDDSAVNFELAESDVAALESNLSAEEIEFSELMSRETDVAEAMETLEANAGNTPKKFFSYTKENGLLAAQNPYCERFLDRKGAYGVYGKIISNYLNAKYRENRSTPMLADDVVGMVKNPAICPNWRNLSLNGRIKFWVWTFAAISHAEAMCGFSKNGMRGVKGVGGATAIGLLQMEKQARFRKYRPASCQGSETAIASSYNNLRCGMDIMEGFIDGSGSRDPMPIYRNYYSRKNYWQELNQAKGGKIGKLMRNFTPCFEKKSSWPIF